MVKLYKVTNFDSIQQGTHQCVQRTICETKQYIGQIKAADSEDNTVEVSFLETKKAMFQWPARPDVIWVDINCVLCIV